MTQAHQAVQDAVEAVRKMLEESKQQLAEAESTGPGGDITRWGSA